MEVLPASPPMENIATTSSKKRRRSIEPLENTKVLGLPPLAAVRGIQESLDSVINTSDVGAFSPRLTAQKPEEASDVTENSPADENSSEGSDVTMRRSLMGLSLQLKLKTMLVEAWASDMNSVVIERSLFAIAKELAILKEMGVYEEETCLRFVQLARTRMENLLNDTERGEKMRMDASQMWTMAQIQAQEKLYVQANSPRDSDPTSEFPLLSGYDSSSRDISVLWKAMSIARDRGAQLWHENKPEQALPFLVAADSYMKRFTLKYQRLKIDHAMVDHLQCDATRPASPTAAGGSSPRTKRVSFAAEPQVLGVADSEVDRSPINPTRPSKLESLLLRTSREFPTPTF